MIGLARPVQALSDKRGLDDRGPDDKYHSDGCRTPGRRRTVPARRLLYLAVHHPGRPDRTRDRHLSDRTIYELASYPAIGRWAAALLGAKRVQLWASQMLYKPPVGLSGEVTGNVGWHQDKQYWRYMEGDLFTAWVAVSDVTGESGPMRFLRGSHRWGLLDSGDFFGHDHEAQRKDIPVPEGENWEEVEAVLPPGAVSFHDRHTYHASGPKTPDRWRAAPTTTCST